MMRGFIARIHIRSIDLIWKHIPGVLPLFLKYKRFIKYVISGCTSASVDLIILFILTHFVGFHYLVSSIMAFSIAFFVSFALQKFWTFQDSSFDKIHHQLLFYLATGLGNLGLNTLLMYLFVDIFGFWYILAQIVAGLLIACGSFFIYRNFIFKKKHTE